MSLYSPTEEAKIVEYIVENDAFHRIKGDKLWKEMEEAKIVERTWSSLKQHFRKKIIHEVHLPRYNLSENDIKLFREYFNREPVKSEKKKAGNRSRAPNPTQSYECSLPSSSDDDDI